MKRFTILGFVAMLAMPLAADDSTRLLTIDHFVRAKSTVPAIAGQQTQIYVRERVMAGTVARGTVAPDRVVLFVHGAGTPAEVAFDVDYDDYSWMAFLARAGFRRPRPQHASRSSSATRLQARCERQATAVPSQS